jgi:hypothetical protein
MSDISSKTEINIALVGCWNNYKQVDGSYPLVNVCNYLKLNESKYDELVILGDNFYPSKEKVEITLPDGSTSSIKKNIFDLPTFNIGFDLIKNINIHNKYLIMGNHDIEDFYTERCINLYHQFDKSDFLKIMFPFKSCPVANTGFKYIFIDTNLYNLSKNPNTCFNTTLHKSALELKNNQNQFIICELKNPSFNNFIICAHEPLFSIKSKDTKFKSSLLDEELLNILFNSRKNITYVCADVHMFQCGIITNNNSQSIKQIVCGTGGADKDSFTSSQSEFKINDDFNFTMQSSRDSFGYVELNISPDNISHKYIKVINSESVLSHEEYKKKYLKYKNKYFNLKYQLNGGAGILGFLTGENKKQKEQQEQERKQQEQERKQREHSELIEKQKALIEFKKKNEEYNTLLNSLPDNLNSIENFNIIHIPINMRLKTRDMKDSDLFDEFKNKYNLLVVQLKYHMKKNLQVQYDTSGNIVFIQRYLNELEHIIESIKSMVAVDNSPILYTQIIHILDKIYYYEIKK